MEYKKGTTEQQKTEFRESAEKYWSGQFGDKNVKLYVVETNAGRRNRITFSDKTGTSYVLFGNRMKLFKQESTEEDQWVEGHETGHLMKLPDQYIEGKDENGERMTTPKDGWENNIMGKFWGIVEEKNIDDILKRNKVNTKK